MGQNEAGAAGPSHQKITRRRMIGTLAAAPLASFALPIADARAQQAQSRQPAQASPQPAPQPVPPPPQATRRIALSAVARHVKLGTNEQGESTVFRLALRDEPVSDPLALPVIRAKPDEVLALDIENRLGQPILFHARGARQHTAFDGVPGLSQAPIAPGTTGSITFSCRQSGTFLLAPSMPQHVAEQTARGLQAILIVEEASPPPVDHDLAFAVGDMRIGEDGLLAAGFGAKSDAARVGRLGNRLTANGRPAPGRMEVRPGARIRLRLVNVSNARVIPLRVSNLVARVIAIDSTPCAPFDPLKRTVIVAPGTRIDMILDLPREPDIEGLVEARLGNGLPIFAFRTKGEPLPQRGEVPTLPEPGLPAAIRLQDALRAEISIAGGASRDLAPDDQAALDRLLPDAARLFTINGQPGGLGGKPLISLRRGRVLVLALMNRTAWPQTLAVHGHSFRLLHAFDDGWEPYFLDTMYLAPNTIARVALIADNPGKWAVRSSIAEHFGSGVATWIEVT